jgi:hypothetical protein
MAVILGAEKETPSHSTVVSRGLTARNAAAHTITPRLDDRAPAFVVTPTCTTLVPRSLLLFRALSRAMTGAYVITPPFGSTYLRARWCDSEHNCLQD